jgi:hypothetical protein
MSDDTLTDSIFTNLKNKIIYNVKNAVTDPKANEYAQQQQELLTQKKKEEEEKKQEKENEEATEKQAQLNKFSGTRLIKKIGNQTVNILQKVFVPFVGLMLAMIVANEMIVYSAPIRIIFFLFTLGICILIPFYALLLAVFYLLKGGYSYYLNNMTDSPKRIIMPYIFTLLPITTYKPLSKFSAFFLYPFTYPKTGIAEEKLDEITKQYQQDLQSSFIDFEKFRVLPIFSEEIKKAYDSIQLINKVVNSDVPSGNMTNNTVTPTNNSKSS